MKPQRERACLAIGSGRDGRFEDAPLEATRGMAASQFLETFHIETEVHVGGDPARGCDCTTAAERGGVILKGSEDF